MENKEIIIDGVDVSGCKNFSCGKCEEENKIPITINHFTADCRMYPNCYYKQLKRKEQECEFSNLRIIQLQETLSQYETDLSTKDCIVETCKAQYKELKAELEQYKKSKQASYEEMQKKCNELELKSRRLAQTLMEIYQYIKSYLFKGGVEPQWVEWQMAQREKEKMAKDILKILQKYKVVLK